MYITTTVRAAMVKAVIQRRAPVAIEQTEAGEARRDGDQMQEQPRACCGGWRVELRRGEQCEVPVSVPAAIKQRRRRDGADRQQQRARHEAVARDRARQLEIDEPGLDFVRGLGGQVDREDRRSGCRRPGGSSRRRPCP